jgi:hypothetical protein
MSDANGPGTQSASARKLSKKHDEGAEGPNYPGKDMWLGKTAANRTDVGHEYNER